MLALPLVLLGRPVFPHSEHDDASLIPRRFRSHHWNVTDSGVCKDNDAECPKAASAGACSTEAEFMRANCRLSCNMCDQAVGGSTDLAKETVGSGASGVQEPPQCKQVLVQAGVPGRMRGHRTYCSERYSEDVECMGRTFDFARLERGRDSWDIIERDGMASTATPPGSTALAVQTSLAFDQKEPKVVFQGAAVRQATHNTAFLCNDDGSVVYYGGRLKAAHRYPTTGAREFYHDHFPGLRRYVGNILADGSLDWSEPDLILDEQRGRDLNCEDRRKGVEVCEFDGKLSVTNFRGRTYIFGRANMATERDSSVAFADTGGRHVQVTSHEIGEPGKLVPFQTLQFDGFTIGPENNIYFLTVMALRDEKLVGLFPAVIEGQGGIFISHSENGEEGRVVGRAGVLVDEEGPPLLDPRSNGDLLIRDRERLARQGGEGGRVVVGGGRGARA